MPYGLFLARKNKTKVLFFAISTKNSDIQVSKLKGLTKIANIILLEGLQQISVLITCVYIFISLNTVFFHSPKLVFRRGLFKPLLGM